MMKNNQYFSSYGKSLPEYISIVSASRCAKIKIDDIEIIEQEGRKIHIVTAERDYAYYERMNSVALMLVGRSFYRVMKGLIINFDQVREVKGYYVSFYSGQIVTMGKNSMSKTKQAYKRYLLKYPPFTDWQPIPRVSEHKADEEKDK